MLTRIHRILTIGILTGSLLISPSVLFAGPNFLNRQAFPLPISLNEIGPFDNNFLKTYDVFTQWNNISIDDVLVTIVFTFYDADSSGALTGEDGQDDALMTVTQTVRIPAQVSHWGKTFRLTTIGEKLNQGFDHSNEGVGLELYVDAQITVVKHLSEE